MSLAVDYRPKCFEEVTEQKEIITILRNQLKDKIQHCYLFCGGAGTGKTTTARIFANEINENMGNPIELDAASNNSVDNMRDLIVQARRKPLDSKYKCFIIDECHMITNAGWNALLKLIEEPPEHCVFIFCTTDPQKIPDTILSRVQRYDYKRISTDGIVDRLKYIVKKENINVDEEVLYYIARRARGGMRDAITLLDKCAAYSNNLTISDVLSVLGIVNYDVMFDITEYVTNKDIRCIECIQNIHAEGKDLRNFIKDYTEFILDICKLKNQVSWNYVTIPVSYKDRYESLPKNSKYSELLSELLNNKLTSNYLVEIESMFYLFIQEV